MVEAQLLRHNTRAQHRSAPIVAICQFVGFKNIGLI